MLSFILLACHPPEDTGSAARVDPELSLSAVQACAEPAALGWEEVGAGMAGHQDPDAEHLDGGGLIVEDLDGDGILEVMVFFSGSPPGLYRVVDGVPVKEDTDWPALSSHPSLLDLNSDGHLDILMTNFSVFWGDDGGGLTLEASSSGGGSNREILSEDLDGDGLQDLLIARTTAGDELESMQDLILWGADDHDPALAEPLPQESAARKAFDAQAMDWDGDGDLDVYVVNDMGNQYGGNVLWRNDGGTLTDVSADCDCGLVMSGMGLSSADYSRDGLLDLYLVGVENNVLLAGTEDGSFVNVTATTGTDPIGSDTEMGWGSTWLDHDNDGDADILALEGDQYDDSGEHSIVYDAPIHLLSQEDDGTFTDVREPLGLTALGSYRAVVAAELNGDGVLDLVVTDVVDRPQVYLSTGCTEAGWLEVIAPVHSRIEVEAGERTQTAFISRDTGYTAISPARAWVGLGEAQRVDRLTITTLDGSVFTAEDFEARRQVQL